MSKKASTTEQLLALLAEARHAQALLEMDYAELRKGILAPVQAELNDLDAEFDPKRESLQHNLEELDKSVKAAVAERHESIRAGGLHAVYAMGRESWDSRGLAGFAVAHPEILRFQRVGDPVVSIRKDAKEK